MMEMLVYFPITVLVIGVIILIGSIWFEKDE